MMAGPVGIGVVGCGNISAIYLENTRRFGAFRVVAVVDALPDRARARATEFGVPKAGTVDEVLADPEVELVLNLTTPNAHAEVALAAVAAGKSVYNEKPLTITREDG